MFGSTYLELHNAIKLRIYNCLYNPTKSFLLYCLEVLFVLHHCKSLTLVVPLPVYDFLTQRMQHFFCKNEKVRVILNIQERATNKTHHVFFSTASSVRFIPCRISDATKHYVVKIVPEYF